MWEKMINNSAADCSILLIFGTESDRMTPDLQQTFKFKGSKVKVTASRNAGENLLNHQ